VEDCILGIDVERAFFGKARVHLSQSILFIERLCRLGEEATADLLDRTNDFLFVGLCSPLLQCFGLGRGQTRGVLRFIVFVRRRHSAQDYRREGFMANRVSSEAETYTGKAGEHAEGSRVVLYEPRKAVVIDRDDDDLGHSSCSGLQIGSILLRQIVTRQ
jgi:hypothetical protein